MAQSEAAEAAEAERHEREAAAEAKFEAAERALTVAAGQRAGDIGDRLGSGELKGAHGGVDIRGAGRLVRN